MENYAYLCECLRCHVTLIDENPQTGALKRVIPEDAKEMVRDEYGYPVCPICGEDGNLVDI